ncbi:MAG: ABC transporter permease, partial [Bacillaceae bacterium G1]
AGVAAALITGVAFGFLLERFIIQTVYGNHIRQILITLGMMLILNELLKVVWGPDQKSASTPSYLSGSWMLGDVTLIKYRLFIIVVGLSVFFLLYYLLNHTRMGLIVRAGVMNKEMVQALGINIHRVFLYVFILGSALAALAGALFAPYSGVIYAELGMEFAILAFIVVVIGGMGNIVGSLMAALLVGLTGAYLAYFVPELSLAANMLLMAVILLWKPSGLFGVKR